MYLVHDFLTNEECDHLVGESIPKMERSVVFSGQDDGAVSSYRSSYSMNMVPDFDDETNVVTKIVRRKFAFARDVAEYTELVEGAGQEPLNSVYYKEDGDQYRPHCGASAPLASGGFCTRWHAFFHAAAVALVICAGWKCCTLARSQWVGMGRSCLSLCLLGEGSRALCDDHPNPSLACARRE